MYARGFGSHITRHRYKYPRTVERPYSTRLMAAATHTQATVSPRLPLYTAGEFAAHPHASRVSHVKPFAPSDGISPPILSALSSHKLFFMNLRRDYRSNRAALINTVEEGGILVSSSYSSHDFDEHDNEKALDMLHDRVTILKILTGEIHEEVDSHNRVLNRVGNDMDASRGALLGTLNRFKRVFATKSSRRIATLVTCFLVVFLIIYYLVK